MTTIYSAIYPNDSHLRHLNGVDHFQIVFQPEEILTKNSILILHGGSDISPSIYGETPNSHTWASEGPSNRDHLEINLAKKAISDGIPIFGICRGAQLLCALAGGKLFQHVTGHQSGDHKIITSNGEVLRTTSAHHQMLNPYGVEHEMLAWSEVSRSREYVGEKDQSLIPPKVEPEVVFFPKIKSLAVQGHPEWLKKEAKFVKYVLSTIQEKLLK